MVRSVKAGSERPRTLPSSRPHPVAAAIVEALQAFATRPVTSRILRRALQSAGVAEIPRGGSGLRRFVAHDLRAATAVTLDDDAALAVTESLTPLLARFPALTPAAGTPLWASESEALLESGPVPTGLPSLESGPAPRGRSAFARDVLVATQDEDRLARLARGLPEEATTLFAEDVVALLELLQQPRREAPVIVLDCQHRAIHPTTLATVATELPPGTQVVLWGLGTTERDSLFALLDDASCWQHLPMEADARTVARRVARL